MPILRFGYDLAQLASYQFNVLNPVVNKVNLSASIQLAHHSMPNQVGLEPCHTGLNSHAVGWRCLQI